MKSMEIVRKVFRRIYLYLVIGIPLYVVFLYFVIHKASLAPFSIIMTVATAIMLAGQISVGSNYGFAYWLYYVSYMVSMVLALFVWMPSHFPFIDVYLFILVAFFLFINIAHIKTRKWLRAFPAFDLFSIFLFGLLIALSTGNITGQNCDLLFGITIVLFGFVAIQILNVTYRNRVLNRELKINNVEEYTERCKKELLGKFKDEVSDVNLLIFYFYSSLERFIEGDFDRSFLDAYKIVFDEDGKAFERIYVLPSVRERMKRYSHIRAVLAHAKGRGAKLPEIKEIKRNLFVEIISLLKIVKFDFIEPSLGKKCEKETLLHQNS